MKTKIIPFPAKRIGLGGYGQAPQSNPLDLPNEGPVYNVIALPAPRPRINLMAAYCLMVAGFWLAWSLAWRG